MEKSNKICRACSGSKGKMHLLYNRKNPLHEKFSSLTSLQVMPGDGLPEQICHDCFAQLNKTLQFIDKCRKTDTELRKNTNDNAQPHLLTVEEKLKERFTPTLNCKEVPVVETPQNQFGQHNKKNTKTQEKTQPYICPHCNKTLKTLYSLKYHMQLHSDKNPYLCYECGDSFKTKNSYEGHMATHEGSLTCDICGKKYRQAASLRNHKMTHTGERPYLCMICGKGCIQKSDFKKHMLTHTDEKSYVCNICGHKYRFSHNLKLHLRSHTGEKPYECETCKKRFSAKDHLKRHSLIHTGEKPYKCNYCWKSFNRASTLVVHKKLHTGQRDHVCNVCGKGFIQAHCLQSHMNTHKKREVEGDSKNTTMPDNIIMTQQIEQPPPPGDNTTEGVIRIVLTDEQNKEIRNFLNTEILIEPSIHMPTLQ